MALSTQEGQAAEAEKAKVKEMAGDSHLAAQVVEAEREALVVGLGNREAPQHQILAQELPALSHTTRCFRC